MPDADPTASLTALLRATHACGGFGTEGDDHLIANLVQYAAAHGQTWQPMATIPTDGRRVMTITPGLMLRWIWANPELDRRCAVAWLSLPAPQDTALAVYLKQFEHLTSDLESTLRHAFVAGWTARGA